MSHKTTSAVDSSNGGEVDDFFERIRKRQSKSVEGNQVQRCLDIIHSVPPIIIPDSLKELSVDLPDLIENTSPTSVDASISTSDSTTFSRGRAHETKKSQKKTNRAIHFTLLLFHIAVSTLLATGAMEWITYQDELSKLTASTSFVPKRPLSQSRPNIVCPDIFLVPDADATNLEQTKSSSSEDNRESFSFSQRIRDGLDQLYDHTFSQRARESLDQIYVHAFSQRVRKGLDQIYAHAFSQRVREGLDQIHAHAFSQRVRENLDQIYDHEYSVQLQGALESLQVSLKAMYTTVGEHIGTEYEKLAMFITKDLLPKARDLALQVFLKGHEIVARLNQISKDIAATNAEIQGTNQSMIGARESLEYITANVNKATKEMASIHADIQTKSHTLLGTQQSMRQVQDFVSKRASRILSRKLDVSSLF